MTFLNRILHSYLYSHSHYCYLRCDADILPFFLHLWCTCISTCMHVCLTSTSPPLTIHVITHTHTHTLIGAEQIFNQSECYWRYWNPCGNHWNWTAKEPLGRTVYRVRTSEAHTDERFQWEQCAEGSGVCVWCWSWHLDCINAVLCVVAALGQLDHVLLKNSTSTPLC